MFLNSLECDVGTGDSIDPMLITVNISSFLRAMETSLLANDFSPNDAYCYDMTIDLISQVAIEFSQGNIIDSITKPSIYSMAINKFNSIMYSQLLTISPLISYIELSLVRINGPCVIYQILAMEYASAVDNRKY